MRELLILGIAGPAAIWGKVNHWIPFHFARLVALRSVETKSDPAMRTVVAGLVLVLMAYLGQAAAVGWLAGAWIGALYLLSLPVAADINFLFGRRLHRARRRARAYLVFRREPRLHTHLWDELDRLRAEALALETDVLRTDLPVATT